MASAKKGDVFEMKLNGINSYIQFIARDNKSLNGDVVRCFNYKGSIAKESMFETLISSGVMFFVHTYISVGIKQGIWTSIGNMPFEKDFIIPTFRATDDNYAETKVSDKWYVWKPNEELKDVGKLNEELKKLPHGGVFQPFFIKEWAETGIFDMKHPE